MANQDWREEMGKKAQFIAEAMKSKAEELKHAAGAYAVAIAPFNDTPETFVCGFGDVSRGKELVEKLVQDKLLPSNAIGIIADEGDFRFALLVVKSHQPRRLVNYGQMAEILEAGCVKFDSYLSD